jgi:hypothetical protein
MMKLQKIIIFISVFFIVVSTFTSCSNEKRLASGKPLRTMDPVSILKKVDNASLSWDWIGTKIDTDIKVNGESESFTLSVRMKRDSAIWISLSPALGVEIARVMLLIDSVKVISKVPLNKFVFEGDYIQLENLLGIPFDFNSFQDLFSGASLELDPFNDKYASEVDGLNYKLIEKIPRRVKKLIEGVSDRKTEKLINKAGASELIVKSYWFDGIGFTPVKDVFRHVESGLYVKVRRFGNEGHRQGYMPSKTKITAAGDGVDFECTLTVKRSRVNKEYTMPFDPPANYERRKSL